MFTLHAENNACKLHNRLLSVVFYDVHSGKLQICKGTVKQASKLHLLGAVRNNMLHVVNVE
jgi:hypothetical protein